MNVRLSTRGFRAAFALALSLASLLVMAQHSQATVTPITSGEVKWGVKHSWRNYVTGAVPKGKITAMGGAQICNVLAVCNTVADYKSSNSQPTIGPAVSDYLHFQVTGGSFDDSTNNLNLELAGSVNFYGHDGALNMTLSDLRVELREGASFISADIDEIPMGGGAPTHTEEVNVSKINLGSSSPTFAGPLTTWSALPGTLTGAAANAFGRYPVGSDMDPLSFNYTGPGGIPLADQFDLPNTPVYAIGETLENLTDPIRTFFDAGDDVLHLLSEDKLTALDPQTLSTIDSIDAPAGESFLADGNTFADDISTVFASTTDDAIEAYTFEAGHYVHRSVGLGAAPTVAWSSSADRLYAFATSTTEGTTPTVGVATFDGTQFQALPAYPTIPTGGRTLLTVFATKSGKLIGSYAPTISGAIPNQVVTPYPLQELLDQGGSMATTSIDGTAELSGYGYWYFGERPDGKVTAIEHAPVQPTRRWMTLFEYNGGIVADVDVNGNFDHPSGAPTYDGAGDLYLQDGEVLRIYRDNDSFGQLQVGPGIRDVTAGESGAYVLHGETNSVSLSRISRVGFTPTVTEQPAQADIELADSHQTRQVSLHSAATGDPAPTVRWQLRAADTSDWLDVAGASTPTLELTVGAANDGDAYRAIWANAAGEIATTVVTLSIKVNDTAAPAVSIVSPATGSSTTATSTTISYTVNDNSDPAPQCTVASGASLPLKLGGNTLTVVCVDATGNVGSASVVVNRLAVPLPAPSAPSIKPVKKSIKVKQGSRKLAVARLTCNSATTCIYVVPKSTKVKVRGKTFAVKLSGSHRVEPGGSSTITASLPTKLVKALRGRSAKLKLTVRVGNADRAMHPKSASAKLTLRG